MTAADLPDVLALADRIHVDYPERPEVFAERLSLFPSGCFAWTKTGTTLGYALAHPWFSRRPPPLDTLLTELRSDADALHLHDVALSPEARGAGAARALIALLQVEARRRALPKLSLVSVGATAALWKKLGFDAIEAEPGVLESYGDAARLMIRAA